MNFEYIDQLLERYWQCETTLEEEQILRSFFSQDSIPAQFEQYAPLFAYEQAASQQTAASQSKGHSLKMLLMPLVKAAAVVAVVLTVGNVTERIIDQQHAATGEAADSYILQEDIAAKIKVIDRNRSDAALAQVPVDTVSAEPLKD